MNETTRLGKISRATFGMGGYDDACIGFAVQISGDGWGVIAPFTGAWLRAPDEHCDWTEADQDREYAAAVRALGQTLKDAKKMHVEELKGTPVECKFLGNRLVSWRVLTEVL